MGIVVFGAVFVDIKGYPLSQYIPGGRNVGRVVEVHGGVSRNVVEDIANVELRPTFVSLVDDTGTGTDVIAKLKRHQVNTSYMRRVKDGLGSWLAIFDNSGDVVASISKRPDLSEIGRILDEQGDEIIQNADSIVVEIDMDSSLLRKPSSERSSRWRSDITRRSMPSYQTCRSPWREEISSPAATSLSATGRRQGSCSPVTMRTTPRRRWWTSSKGWLAPPAFSGWW